MINLLDEKFESKEVKVFNSGKAGVVESCSFKVERKSAKDADNAPDYKLFLIDENSGEMNEGLYTPKEDASEAAKDFFVKKMLHYIKEFEVPAIDKVESYGALLDYTMKGIRDVQDSDTKVNVAVCYGNTKRPNRFLEIDGFWGLKNVKSATPRLSNNALTERPEEASSQTIITKSTGSEDNDW